jgi:hypothetical protein
MAASKLVSDAGVSPSSQAGSRIERRSAT